MKTLNIGTRLLDNTAFVLIHMVEGFSKDFPEALGLRSQGLQQSALVSVLSLMDDNNAVHGIMKRSVINFRNSGLNVPKYLLSRNHFSLKGLFGNRLATSLGTE